MGNLCKEGNVSSGTWALGRRLRMAALFLIVFGTSAVWAQIQLSTNTAYTQDFNGMGTSATATLPDTFRVANTGAVRTVSTYDAAGTATVRQGGATLSTSAANGIYNFGAGTTMTGNNDRAVGFLSSGTATTTGNLFAQFQNNTGTALSGLKISYNVEKYRQGSNPAGFRLQLYYSFDGTTWTSAGANFLTSFSADADNSGYATAPGDVRAISDQVLSITIPNGNLVYLAWNYSVTSTTTTTNAQALAVDDISVIGLGSGPTNPSGSGTASPGTVQAGFSTALSVLVVPGANPTSTGLAVSADLSSIGGSANQIFYDDGTHGDSAAGDNVFTFQATVPAITSAGSKTLPVTITDAQSRTGSTSIALTVTPNSTPPTGTGSANPNSVKEGQQTLLTVTATPGTNPTSTGITVTGDLSSIGGSGSQQFYDDGTHGDAVAGDNVFSYTSSVASGTTPGTKSLPITIGDAQSRSGSTTISLGVIPPPPPTTVKISQYYGGGGNSGSTYTNDFIELFNQSATPVDISNWTVQYNSATASMTWATTPLCTSAPCVIAPYHYYLVQEAAGTGGTTALPAADVPGTIPMGATQAKVALVAGPDALMGACPTGTPIVDMVGIGGANCSEVSPAPTLTNTTAAVRKNNGCIDTDNNSKDFVAVGPIPRNSASPANYCGGDPTRLSGVGIANPGSLEPASNTLLTVKVTPATNPPSTGTKVEADLTPIGGDAHQQFYEDATHGDQSAGDNVFSFEATIGAFIPTGVKNILSKITDDEDREETAPITLTVESPTCGVERWSVKVGVDPDASQVNLNNPIPSTIANLRSFPAPVDPPGPPDNARVVPVETTVWQVDGTITLYKKETDVDYHIVLQDDQGRTIVTEIPSPACLIKTDPPRLPAYSPFAAAIANVRAKFDAKFNATTFFQSASVPVRMKGVGFFDFIHGQTGVAPNGFELHPILDISFQDPTTTMLMSGENPARFGVGVTLTATVMANGQNIPSGQVTFYDGGNPGGVMLGTAMLDANGQATLTATGLSSGSHSITAEYEGDDNSTHSVSAALIQLVDTPPTLTLPADFTVQATSPAGAIVTYVATGADANGTPTNVLCNPASGSTFPIGVNTVSCTTEDARHNVATGEFHVSVVYTAETLSVAPASGAYAGPATLTATLTSGGNPVSGKTITFAINGTTVGSGTTDVNGVATANITINIGGGTWPLTASFAGDSSYVPTSGSSTITVTATPASLSASVVLTKLGNGDYQGVLTITNTGGSTASNVTLTKATLGTANGNPIPQNLGNLGAGASVSATITFPATAGTSGATVVETYQGSYTGGTFGLSVRAKLP